MKHYSLDGRLLYKFLMKERVLYLYIEELLKQNSKYSGVIEYKKDKDVLALLSDYCDINYSLHWATTIQGHCFWESLYNKFNSEREKLSKP